MNVCHYSPHCLPLFISSDGGDEAQNQKGTSTGMHESWCFSKNYCLSIHAHLRMPSINVK